MATFFTDTDWDASGEFAESAVSLAVAYDLPDFRIDRFRVPFPVTAGATPYIRLYNSSDVAQPIGPGGSTQLFFDTSVSDAWNWATPPSPLNLPADVYRVTVVATRYRATSGFFAGGSVTRGDITAIGGRFTGGDAAPGSTSTAAYLVDIDGEPVSASAEGTADVGLNLAVGVIGARASRGVAALGIDLAPLVAGARVSHGVAALGLQLSPSVTGAHDSEGALALGLNLAVAAAGRRASRGAVALGINLAVSVSGSNGSIGRPVASWPFPQHGVSSYPWTPRPVRSFSEVPEP